MIVVTACFPIETRWVRQSERLRVVRTPMGAAACDALHGDAASGATLLVATGFCGAADRRLRPGELTLASAVRHLGEEIRVDARLLEWARATLVSGSCPVAVGVCECVDRIQSVSEKQALARLGVTTVDMESGPLSRWAGRRELPFLPLRAVIDSADVALPVTAGGAWKTAMVRRPLQTASLSRRAVIAGRALGRAITALAETWEERS